jgi:hypothetical protein
VKVPSTGWVKWRGPARSGPPGFRLAGRAFAPIRQGGRRGSGRHGGASERRQWTAKLAGICAHRRPAHRGARHYRAWWNSPDSRVASRSDAERQQGEIRAYQADNQPDNLEIGPHEATMPRNGSSYCVLRHNSRLFPQVCVQGAEKPGHSRGIHDARGNLSAGAGRADRGSAFDGHELAVAGVVSYPACRLRPRETWANWSLSWQAYARPV